MLNSNKVAFIPRLKIVGFSLYFVNVSAYKAGVTGTSGARTIVSTTGAYASQVFLETPVAAQAIAVGSGVTPQDIIDMGSEAWTNAEGPAAVDSKAAILARIERATQTP